MAVHEKHQTSSRDRSSLQPSTHGTTPQALFPSTHPLQERSGQFCNPDQTAMIGLRIAAFFCGMGQTIIGLVVVEAFVSSR